MSKPDDIPQDVWETAEAVEADINGPDHSYYSWKAIARAIMAERERASTWYLDAIAQRDRYAAEREQMAQDWCNFCEAIGLDVDTHEAVAEKILSRMTIGITEGHSVDGVGIADIIMAEREACAQVVQDTPEAIEHPAGPLYASGWAHAVIAIREAIRNRGAAA